MAKRKTVRGFIPYKSYLFRDKDPVIDQVRTAVEDSGMTFKEIHDASDVSTSTVYNWFYGNTRRPQFATVEAVARACGQTFQMNPYKGRK